MSAVTDYVVYYLIEGTTEAYLDAVFRTELEAQDRANEINRGAPKHKPAAEVSYCRAWVVVR